MQLRLLDLIFSGSNTVRDTANQNEEPRDNKRRSRRRRKAPTPNTSDAVAGKKGPNTRILSGTGAVSTLVSVYKTEFFKKPRLIGDILEHCETNLARKIKANELSGKLGRMVRNGELKRTKNADGQYEYTKA